MNRFRLFGYFFLASSVSALTLYYLLRAVMPGGDVYESRWRYNYHNQYPYDYILLVCSIYALLSTFVVKANRSAKGSRQVMIIFLLLTGSLIISAAPGGMLYELHDMMAGFFPQRDTMIEHFRRGAKRGFLIGLPVVALSIPYNIIGLLAGYFITRKGFELADGEGEASMQGE